MILRAICPAASLCCRERPYEIEGKLWATIHDTPCPPRPRGLLAVEGHCGRLLYH